MNEPVFHQLRTKEQLGYIVTVDVSDVCKHNALNIRLQSNSKDPDYLEHRMNVFLESLHEDWANRISEAIITDALKTMKLELEQKITSQSEEMIINWSMIL